MERTAVNVWRGTLGWFVVAGTTLFAALIVGLTGAAGETPSTEVVILIVWIGSTFGSFCAMRDPRLASRILLGLTPLALLLYLPLTKVIAGRLINPSRPLWLLLLDLFAVLAITVLPSLFWRFVSRRQWPPLLPSAPFSRWPVLATTGVACAIVFVTTISVVAYLSISWWGLVGDCGQRPLLDADGNPRNTDFTAKVLFVGPATFAGYSLWAIARVEERYSDGPESFFGYVILRNFFQSEDRFRWFFVEGYRGRSSVARILPIIERFDCGHSRRLEDAAVPLRILRDRAPSDGVRVVGRVYVGRLSDPMHQRAPSSGIRVLVKGPSGETIVTTDAEGIFDVRGLAKGEYTVELPNRARSGVHTFDFHSSPVGEANFYIDEPTN